MDNWIVIHSVQPNVLHSYWVIVRTNSWLSMVMRLVSSKQQRSLDITFTSNLWTHFVTSTPKSMILIIKCIWFHFKDTWVTATRSVSRLISTTLTFASILCYVDWKLAQCHPEFANAKCCVDGDDHLGQLGWLGSTSCFPFGHNNNFSTYDQTAATAVATCHD